MAAKTPLPPEQASEPRDRPLDYPGRINHPKKDGETVSFPFVASGTAPDGIDLIAGRLVLQKGAVSVPGWTLPFPKTSRWAILFDAPPQGGMSAKHRYVPEPDGILEVFGIAIDGQGKPSASLIDTRKIKISGQPSASLIDTRKIKISGQPPAAGIRWPPPGTGGICDNNFVPYGLYSGSGDITASLSGGMDLGAQSVAAVNNVWSAQFPAFGPALNCTLNLNQGGTPQAQNGGLGFVDC